ncbi:MAG: amidohydrolase [Acidimicrobiales bacterium]
MASTADVDVRIGPAMIVPVSEAPFDGYVEVSGTRISHVGPTPSAATAKETISAQGRVVIPAFVNTHCHTSQQLGRGLADDVDLLTWLHDRIWPYEAALSEEDCAISAQLCALEQIRNGCTTLADPGGQHVDGMARGLEAAGVRALLGRSSMDEWDGVPTARRESTREVLDTQSELAARWHGRGRLRFSYTLRTIFNCSDELIIETVERARQLGTIVQMHVAEVREENEHVVRTRGASTVRHLARLGVLSPRFLAVHVVWVDDAEIELLAASGTYVSHNVASNLRVLGIPRVADMFDAGVVVALGTDGAPANNRMSMIDEMWIASMLQKGLRVDPTVLPADQVVRMATHNGARALGLGDELGTLAVGKAADLVVVDPATANMCSAADLTSALVTSMKSENVESVMCEGEWLLRDRHVSRFDETALLQEATARAAAIRARAGIRIGPPPTTMSR